MTAEPLPGVSYVIPVLNEERYIERAVRTVLEQDYAGERELILALGPSTDGTDEIVERLAEADPRVRWVRNPHTDIPAGLNLAIRASRHPVIVRVDAHSELESHYTSRAVQILQQTGAANTGGLMRARGRTPFQSAVARAYNSRIGLGGGQYHGGTEAGPAESAYLGVFRRDVLVEVGLYDESVRRGEDWELNLRIRSAGHVVWFDPSLEVTYWPREHWGKLVRQFHATGAWRGELVRRYRGSNPWRFFVPPMLVVALVLSLVVGVLQLTGVLTGSVSLLMSAVHLAPLSYVALVLWFAFVRERSGSLRDRWLYAVVLPSMHVAWGIGFIWGILRGAHHVVDTSRTEL